MKISLISSNGVVFRAESARVSLGTASGNITILTGHMSLASVVEPSIVSIHDVSGYPEEFASFVKNGVLHFSVGKGLLYIHRDSIRIAVSYAKYHTAGSTDSLLQKKASLEQQLIALRSQASLEDINDHLDEIKQVQAELKLYSLIAD